MSPKEGQEKCFAFEIVSDIVLNVVDSLGNCFT